MRRLRIGTHPVFIGLRIYDKKGEHRALLANGLCYACNWLTPGMGYIGEGFITL